MNSVEERKEIKQAIPELKLFNVQQNSNEPNLFFVQKLSERKCFFLTILKKYIKN